jgi:GxxExxY protein
MFEPIPDETEQIVSKVMDAAFKVHRTLGPGLLEGVYEVCLCYELTRNAVAFQRQVIMPVVYEDIRLDAGLRLDLLVADQVIVELKAVEKMNSLYEAQLLTYLKLTGKRIGLLINFNVPVLKDGFKRMVC